MAHFTTDLGLLYESGDLDIATSFWNSRRFDIGYSNKLILPKEDFVKNLKEYLSLLSIFLPTIREIRVHIKLSNDDAADLAKSIYNIFTEIERDILVNLFYKGFGFDFQLGKVHFSKPVVITREISSLDKSIHFSPEVPSGYENSNYLFGYDAEIEFSSGRSISMPFTQSSAILLSNPIEQIEYSENASGYLSTDLKLLKPQSVRPSSKGVTGLAVSNNECRIYFPESKEIISRWLKDTGFSFEINDHTRYAKGFIKRFGGFDKTRNLINSSGIIIFSALNCDEAKQCGLRTGQKVVNKTGTGFHRNNHIT